MNKIEKEANDIDVKKLTWCLFMSSYDEKMSPKIILQKAIPNIGTEILFVQSEGHKTIKK